MKTIDLKNFTDNFIEISSSLTPAEIRILYLFITEPSVILLSQQKIADKIGKDRRTVNIGMKKLMQLGYTSDIFITSKKDVESDKNISTSKGHTFSKNIFQKTSTKKDPSYQNLLYEYLVHHKNENIIQLFENHPEKHKDTIWNIMHCLPDDIDELAEKYNLREELSIIRISLKHIEEYKKNKRHEEKDFLSLTGVYITKFNAGKKEAAMKVIKEALVFQPFRIEEFMKKIRPYKFDGQEEQVQAMILEIYNTDKLYQFQS